MACLAAPAAPADEELPQWEAGAGLAALRIPDYRGSTKYRNYLLPLPYIVYRGETVKVDKEGAHADLFRSDTVKLDVSLNAGPPAKSTDDGVRSGMPDIDPTFEVGPVLKVLLLASGDGNEVLSLRLPARAVYATNFRHSEPIGWTATPHVNFDAFNLGGSGWNLGLAAGPVYGSERYHDYYYQVDAEYASATRPEYNARGGYGGLQTTVALGRRFPRFWAGAFVRYDSLSGAVFENSPLVEKKSSVMFGGGVSWVFAVSSKTVRVTPELLK